MPSRAVVSDLSGARSPTPTTADVVVVGAGIAGLATALFAARAGSRVVLLERDAGATPVEVGPGPNRWRRAGVPQFSHGHITFGLARLILREQAPDVLDDLIATGAVEKDFSAMLPVADRAPEDGDLVTLHVRRSVLEWVLRTAVTRQSGVTVRSGVRVVGLAGRSPDTATVQLSSGETLPAPWIVDASGRTSALPRWLAGLGARPVVQRIQSSGTLYFARRLRLRPGVAAPTGDWLIGPMGDLGYLSFSLLPEDAGHFVVTINTPPSDHDLKQLRDADLWMRAARLLTPLRAWLDPDVADPMSPVLALGRPRNILRDFRSLDPEDLAGIVPVGDAVCHTNPTHGQGIPLALHHARTVAAAIHGPGSRVERTAAVIRQVAEHAEPYYRNAAGEDAESARIAAGATPRWERPDNPLFWRKVVYPQATSDAALFRAVLRRVHLLDHPDELANNQELLRRVLDGRRHREGRPPAEPPEPSRGALLAALRH